MQPNFYERAWANVDFPDLEGPVIPMTINFLLACCMCGQENN